MNEELMEEKTTVFRCRDLTAASNLYLEEIMTATNDDRLAPLIFSMILLGDDTIIDAGIREDWKAAIGKVMGKSLQDEDLIELKIPGPADMLPLKCLIQFIREVESWARANEYGLIADDLETLRDNDDTSVAIYGSITLDRWSELMDSVTIDPTLGRLKLKR